VPTRLGIGLVAALTSVWLALPASADLPPSPPSAPAETPTPATIAAPEIVSRAEDAKALARRIVDQTSDDAVRDEIRAKLPSTATKLRELNASADALLDGAPTLDALADLDVEWRARAKTLADWRVALTRSAQTIESDRAELQGERESWERTRAAPDAAALPPMTLARVSETVEMLTRAEQTLERQRSETLNLQGQVAEEELVVGAMVDRIARLRGDIHQRLLQRDAPPLWSAAAYAPSGDPRFVPAKLRAAAVRRLNLLDEFRQLTISRLQIEAAVFALMLLALYVARRRASQDPEPDEVDGATTVSRRLLERPISGAIVVAFAVATWVLPRPPGLSSEAEALVLLVPVLRLLPSELWSELRPAMLWLAVAFTVGSLRQVFSALPTVERFLILPEILGLIALTIWIIRGDHVARLQAIGRFGSAVPPFARVALVLAVAALVANVFGLALLSRVILRGLLSAVYGAIALFALVRFGSGLVTGLLRSAPARRLRLVRDHGEFVRRRLITLMVWTGVGLWVYGTLQSVGLDDSVGQALSSVLAAKLEVGTVSLSLGNLVAFGVTLWLSWVVSRFLRFVLDEDVLPRLTLPRGVPAAISTGTHYVILDVAFLIAIGAAGFDLGKFTLLAGALGVGIGFGLQNVVNNFVSGLILLFERPVQTGDMIEVGPLQGEVKRIGIRSSTVRTFDGADVIVPNAALISERLVNWTFADRSRRIDLEVGVAYGSDPNKVLALLLETARAHAEVMSLPEPQAFFTQFQDSALAFQLRIWCRFELAPRIKSELGIAIHDALRGAGIEIPFPQTDVHLKVESGQE
jgi:potassium efflux system protein